MYAAVFVGGALGSLAREFVVTRLPTSDALGTTFAVNVLASLLLGWFVAVRHRVHEHALHLGAIGFCGGLSTFSSFAAEIVSRATSGDVLGVALAPALEIVAGLLAAVLGLAIGRASCRSAAR